MFEPCLPGRKLKSRCQDREQPETFPLLFNAGHPPCAACEHVVAKDQVKVCEGCLEILG